MAFIRGRYPSNSKKEQRHERKGSPLAYANGGPSCYQGAPRPQFEMTPAPNAPTPKAGEPAFTRADFLGDLRKIRNEPRAGSDQR